jgi:hypothetical protein
MLYMRVGKLKGITVIDENDEKGVFQILLAKIWSLEGFPKHSTLCMETFPTHFCKKNSCR